MAKRTTKHADRRIRERFGNVDGVSLANGARHNGIALNDLANYASDIQFPMLKKLFHNKGTQGKTVRLYMGYVFIFFNSSKRLITMYPIASEFLEEYGKARFIEEIKREIYRKERRQ